MPVRRDQHGEWFFRTTVHKPDGTKQRISGWPGTPGPYADLGRTQVGAREAECRAIALVLSGKSIAQPVTTAIKEAPTIREYAEKFMDGYSAAHKPSTRLDKRHRLDCYILPPLGDLRLDALRQEDIDQLVAALLRRGLHRKTINNVLAVLSSLVRYAVKNKVIAPVDLSCMIKSQGGELVAVAPGDVDKLLVATTDPRYRAAILLAADAGLRIGEIRALRWSDVNELAREISIARSYDRTQALTDTKGWECRAVPISERLWTALRAVKRLGPVVISRLDGEPLGYDVVREMAVDLYVRAGVTRPPMPWHSLRHSFGTGLANAGVPVHVIKVLMGHKSIETTLRYMHTDREAKRDAIAALRGSRVASSRSRTKQGSEN